MGREFYSIPEAAALLGISRIAVFKRVKKGQLEALRFGRNWAVPAAALARAGELRAGAAPSPLPAAAKPQAAPVVRAAAGKQPAASTAPRPDAELDSMGWD